MKNLAGEVEHSKQTLSKTINNTLNEWKGETARSFEEKHRQTDRIVQNLINELKQTNKCMSNLENSLERAKREYALEKSKK